MKLNFYNIRESDKWIPLCFWFFIKILGGQIMVSKLSVGQQSKAKACSALCAEQA